MEHEARLRPACQFGKERDDTHGNPVDRAVDHLAISAGPQKGPQPFCRTDKEEVIALIKQRYEQPLREIFAC